MDYSSISPDPAEPSPWGSPRADRNTFASAGQAADVLPAPLPPHLEPSYEDGHENETSVSSGQAGLSPANVTESSQSAQIGKSANTQPSQPADNQQPPQQQGQSQTPARYQTGARQNARPLAPAYKLQAKLTGLERTGKKDPILRFDVYTNIPKFRTTQYRDVRRTHSEFVKLSEHLISSNPEALVPAVPPPLTPAGAGTDEDEIRVKASMQRWLNNVFGNEVLIHDEEIVLFVESDFGYSPVVRMKQPATGVRRKVIKQFAPPPDDTPELQNARPVVKRFYLGALDTSQKVDRVVKSRRGLGLAESDLGVKLGHMHVQETHTGLGNAYRKLGRIIQTTGDYHAAQATAEATTLGDPLEYHSSDAFIVKETLTNRHILLRELLQAQQTARSKRAAADRLKGSTSVRTDKVDEAIAALDDAIGHETYLTKKTQRVTANLLLETRRWFSRTSDDVLASLRDYTLREIEAERRTLALLESVRADVRAIDSTGGLSRLGRESHPTVRRSSLASSQGPKGDAWSGVPRRGDSLSRSISGSTVVVPVLGDDSTNGDGSSKGRARALSGVSSIAEEDDDGRLDAKNAASRLATSTF
ncbi:vacuolar protein sorting-associated protein vps17 [Talaromyces proteolyticus]|uniref:Vacuolar protein sorting-associated protein 17 n=1 Tax=Talaromyces proteolyticus TaxID=1131652 RepID=A0AAD4Q1P1_9EURO|nr:vacuolar protein sorting-associated protein vps17 [Talaromyces proteolyticus]KAH8702469.1 vacuolar protein sorting-associated protein vps17 [Talaromyces proteolyticus]